jgi:acyl-coenzyme A thioesterase PaaI-like protein
MGDQDKYGPNGICFGCGPKNENGLQIKSQWEEDQYITRYTPKEEHQAFNGVINGGIIGALFDCHMNWCAATTLYEQNSESEFPSTVTAEFAVKLKRPTPFGEELVIKAKPTEINDNMVTVEAEMYAENKVTSTCKAVFVAVQPGHPAYHRWD